MKKNVKRLIAGAVVLLVAAGIVVRIAGGNKKKKNTKQRPTVAVEKSKNRRYHSVYRSDRYD